MIKNGFNPILSLSDFLHLGKQWMVIWASGPLRVNCALETSQMELGALAGGIIMAYLTDVKSCKKIFQFFTKV